MWALLSASLSDCSVLSVWLYVCSGFVYVTKKLVRMPMNESSAKYSSFLVTVVQLLNVAVCVCSLCVCNKEAAKILRRPINESYGTAAFLLLLCVKCGFDTSCVLCLRVHVFFGLS